jgi:hypothetical protein
MPGLVASTAMSPESDLGNSGVLQQLVEADTATFQAAAEWEIPILDPVIPLLSCVANNSVLRMGIAAMIAALRGQESRESNPSANQHSRES